MTNPTSNFGWQMPTSTDLVTDLPADFEVFGQAVDTSLADLKGGTSGQILSKASGTDMDFTWITNDVGDITAVTAGTGITGGGTSGAVTVSFDQANFGGGQGAAGKNRVLNASMQVAQRGTSFSIAASTGTVTNVLDRWQFGPTATSQACTVSRVATNDTTNLPNIQYAMRMQRNSGQTGNGVLSFVQNFESINSIPFAGKNVTVSYYARAGANYSSASNALPMYLATGTGTDQNIYGGFTGVSFGITGTATLTTTWQRFTFSGTVPTNATQLAIYAPWTTTGTAGANDYVEITGVQVEIGSTATPYAPNGATYQAELAACQRYYVRFTPNTSGTLFAVGTAESTTLVHFAIPLPVTMRTNPTADLGTLRVYQGATAYSSGTFAIDTAEHPTCAQITYTHGSAVFTAGYAQTLNATSTSTSWLGFVAEL
jgi:hypothetical protein